MPSQTEILNIALMKLGEDVPATSGPDDLSKPARAGALAFPAARDALLEDHPWNFAKEYASVAKDGAAPTFRWTNQYSLPVDPYCLAVREVLPEGTKYEVVGRKIYTDAGPPLQFIYTKKVEDETQFSPLFVWVLIRMLALEMAAAMEDPPVTKLVRIEQDLERWHRRARGSDAQQGTRPPTFADSFVRSRR